MAELAASLVVGPLVSLLKDKVSNYLLDQYKVMEGMEKQHKILKRKLPAILDIMADAEKQASRQGGVKAWLEELKTVAYEANNVFDEFEYEALRRQAKKNGHITKLGMAGVKLFPTHNRVAFRNRMGNKLSSIVEAIKVLVEEMKDFGFDKPQLEAPALKEWRQTDSIIVDPENIVSRSRDKERKEIVAMLLNHQASDGDLLVLPIVGMGGLGKTTLAQLIYNDPQVKEHFQLLKWVCVSDDFNVCKLANEICNESEKILEKALNKLQEHLRGKRYLLVLDDVWNKDIDKWRKLKACLKQGGVGSAILTTTRDKEIAEFMGTTANNSWKNRYRDLAILDTKFIHEIIETRAFSLQKTKPDELVKLVGPIAKRCVGSPLAAKALGSVLRNKPTKEEWEDILHRSRICDDETGILPILKLSYNDMPTDMKQCFAFCAIYPKDYQIDVDKLIQLWMANGYISDQNKVPAETMGKRIVKEMVSRSFFQYEEQRRIGYSSATFVKIHDLMHDVALSASEKECVCITDEFIQSGELLPNAARHVLIQKWIDKQRHGHLYGSMRKMPLPMQTIMIDQYYYNRDIQYVSKYNSLRALSMPGSRPIGDLSIKPKHLCHLRYLDLSRIEDMEALPDDISVLYSLQTLKLSNCSSLKRLPEQMKFMTALRHLYTDGCEQLECMPPELGRITCLRTITWFVVGSGLNCSGLEELKDLSICGSLRLKQLENVTRGGNAKEANLESKRELKKLSLEWTSGKEEEQQCHEVLESLKVHDGLLALKIYSYQGTTFPSWMGMLKNMVELRLSNCSKAEHLPPLCQLAELQLLHLKGLGKLQFLCSSCTSSTFGKLKDLTLVNLDAFDGFCETPHGGAVAFPQLEILHVEGCKNLAALPEASVLREMCGGGDDTVARSAFPELKRLTLEYLNSFERWETAALETEEDDALLLFPSLETVFMKKCPKLTTLPRAPKLKDLEWREGNGEISIGGFGYMTSLSSLHLGGVKLDDKEERDHPSSVVDMKLDSCSLFFQPRALALWVCYGQLQDLSIDSCDDLVFWPEEVFQSLISLRRLWIWNCKNLIGYTSENGPDQATSSSGRSQLLPHLESLEIHCCESLVEVFNSPALKTMEVTDCRKLESLCGKQRLNQEASSSTNDVTASTPAEEEKLPPSVAPGKLLPSSLESLRIWECDGLSEAVDLPSSLRGIDIRGCSKLRFISSPGQLDALQDLTIRRCPELRSLESLRITDLSALEVLHLYNCKSLASLPSAPESQEYSSLRELTIKGCPGIKSLPSALQQRVDSGLVVYTDLHSRLQGRFPRLLGRLCSSLSNS